MGIEFGKDFWKRLQIVCVLGKGNAGERSQSLKVKIRTWPYG
jgi:hypothetical protein